MGESLCRNYKQAYKPKKYGIGDDGGRTLVKTEIGRGVCER